MLNFMKNLSMKRGGWFTLFLSGILLEMTALYFQHGMDLSPCVMCIYERVALFGIVFSGLIGFIAPKFLLMRLLALFVGLGSAIKGLAIALDHLELQLNPGPWSQCPAFVDFPQTLPLDKWLPQIFNPTAGNCSEITWQFLSFSMVQWITVMFSVYTVLLLLLLISQFKRTPQHRRLFR